jgi:hypothetical protein
VVAHAQVHGYVVAFTWASGAMLLAAVVSITLIRIDRDTAPADAVHAL